MRPDDITHEEFDAAWEGPWPEADILTVLAAQNALRDERVRADERERIAELIRPMLATGWPDEILAAIREGGQHGE